MPITLALTGEGTNKKLSKVGGLLLAETMRRMILRSLRLTVKKNSFFGSEIFAKRKNEADLIPVRDKAISNLSNIDVTYEEGTIEEIHQIPRYSA